MLGMVCGVVGAVGKIKRPRYIYGLKYGIHSGVFQKVVTLDSLFEP